MATQTGFLPRYFKSYLLIPNTKTYLHGTEIRKLPVTIAAMTLEAQKKFVETLKSTDRFSFRTLTEKKTEFWLQKTFEEAQKLIPKGHYTEKVFLAIKTTERFF